MSEEWGPWIEHDGKVCPCVGRFVQCEYQSATTNWRGRESTVRDGKFSWGIATGGPSWLWGSGYNPILRYRIRKPRGLTILENLLADLPAPQPGKVDA